MKKRVLSLFLAITLCLTLTPTGGAGSRGTAAGTDGQCNAGGTNPCTCAGRKRRRKDHPCTNRRG